MLGIGLVAGMLPHWREMPEPGAQTVDRKAPAVAIVLPKKTQPAPSLAIPAEIKPRGEAPIYARANGYLKRRLVDIGDHVKAGQLLAEIDTPELDQELERSRAQLAQAQAVQELAKITVERWSDLVKTASVSEQETAEKIADFKLKTAVVASARADVNRLEKLKAFASVTAPFDGTITVRNVDMGDLIVAAGAKEMFHLAQTRVLRVCVQVPQNMARSIAGGQWAEMSIPELPGRSFRARVVRTAGAISADSRTLPVELEVDNHKEEIFAGGYAQVRFIESQMEPVLTLPANTVMFRSDGPKVGIVQSDGRVDLRTVKLGRDFGQTLEILDGLGSEDRAVINPPESLATGDVVTVSEPAKPERSQ